MGLLCSFFQLLLFQLAGEALRAATHLPVPGPVLGMVLLTLWYLVGRRQPKPALTQTAHGLLGWLGLLFVPAGVGIVANLALLRSAWLPIAVGLLGSTLLTLVVTAWTMEWLDRRARLSRSQARSMRP